MGEDFMARCRFCGQDVQWVEKSGLRQPVDPDFGDHRQSCTGMTLPSPEKVRSRAHERRVTQFLAKRGKR